MRFSLTLAAAGLILAGCATPAETQPKGAAKYKDDVRLGEKVDKLCFTSNIDSFGNTNRDTFTVREGRDYYLIEVFGTCLSLEHAMSIRLPTASICLRPGDHVIVSESMLGHSEAAFSTQRCTVNAIYEWNPKAKDKAEEDSEASAEES